MFPLCLTMLAAIQERACRKACRMAVPSDLPIISRQSEQTPILDTSSRGSGILAGSRQIAIERLGQYAVIGELGLDGAAWVPARSPRTAFSQNQSGSRSILPEVDFFHSGRLPDF